MTTPARKPGPAAFHARRRGRKKTYARLEKGGIFLAMQPSPIAARPRVLFRPPARARPRSGLFPRSVLVLGGCRSGKTAWAEALGLEWAGKTAGHGSSRHPVYIATALAGDNDPGMQARIARHRALRDPAWRTLEAPLDLPEALAGILAGIPAEKAKPSASAAFRPQVVLIDCITVWLANLMAAGHDQTAILERTDRLAELLRDPPCPVLLVSNETGLGVAPSTALGNQFRDLAGLVNQKLVKSCGDVYLIVSGLPQQLKSVSETSARRKFRPCRVCT